MSRKFTTEMQAAKFWEKVDQRGAGDCWTWTGCIAPNGYGRYRNAGAHRFSWMVTHRSEIPEGMSVLHRCDNRSCVNPHHLFIGSQKDNVADCIAKGRFPSNLTARGKGEKCPRAKLTNEQVLDIRSRFTGSHGELRMFAKEFGVTIQNIWRLLNRKTWNHI